MKSSLRAAAALSAIVVVALVATTRAAKVDVKSDRDKQFDFSKVKTWSWDPKEPGKVIMARSSQDNSADVQRRFGQTILDAISSEFTQRGLTGVSPQPGDVRVYYYLVVTVGFDTQTMGQFLPAVPEWGVAPYVPQTTSFDIVQNGALVIDAVSNQLDRVVWRVIGRTELDTERTDDQRRARIKTVVRELVKRFPKK
ncbi:MAG TPA: DUF4136 domain-containing protein [Vicinamibacterales bacterium]|nr:DUF4136 domain-containing protein [Vicinamibacterales bacterium]